MQDSGHFCPYPRTYPARIGRSLQLPQDAGRRVWQRKMVGWGASGNSRWPAPPEDRTEVGAEALTKGFRPHFAADARTIPAFERSGKG